MDDYLKKLTQSADFIKERIGKLPEIAIILGSGLGPLVDEIDGAVEIDYRDIPNFPSTTVEGHAGKLISGVLSGKRVLVMKGRFHFYEGYDISQVIFHIRIFKLLGIERLIVTNAAGGINGTFRPGDLMLIRDHISFFAPSPLRGQNLGEFGVRFPDMSRAYDRELSELALKVAEREGIEVKQGVYIFAQGPMYETPAEIKAFQVMGADAVGMSTAPEVIVAIHGGMKVLGISCITNMAAGILDKPLSHIEVMETAKIVGEKFKRLVKSIVKEW